MYAIVKTGGKQYKAEIGRFIDVEKLDAQVGEEVAPVVEGVKVVGKVIAHDKAKKLVVFKFHNKTGYRKKQGHRQPYTRVEIVSIG